MHTKHHAMRCSGTRQRTFCCSLQSEIEVGWVFRQDVSRQSTPHPAQKFPELADYFCCSVTDVALLLAKVTFTGWPLFSNCSVRLPYSPDPVAAVPRAIATCISF